MRQITLRAYAKVNLFLDIAGVRGDGYHLVRTVMQSVGLYDTVRTERTDRGISLVCDRADLPCDRRNIACAAAYRFFERTGIRGGCRVELCKRIPSEAGMGGGSADGAAVLYALNRLYGSPLDGRELSALAAGIGADVPFCLAGGCRYLGGIGDELLEEYPVPAAHLLIAKPGEGISTPAAYRELDRLCDRFAGYTGKSSEGLRAALAEGRVPCGQDLFNIFEITLGTLAPRCLSLLQSVRQLAPAALLCGSGTAVFGLFGAGEDAQWAAEALRKAYPDCYITTAPTVARGLGTEEES